jgi:hypothetical protein
MASPVLIDHEFSQHSKLLRSKRGFAAAGISASQTVRMKRVKLKDSFRSQKSGGDDRQSFACLTFKSMLPSQGASNGLS